MGILNKACCCCQLTTAAVLLGCLGAIGAAICGISSNNFFEADAFMDVIHLAGTCTGLLVSLVNLIGCSYLIAGSIKKIRHLIVPWLIGEIIYIIIVAFCCGAYLFEFLIYQLSYTMLHTGASFLNMLFQIYVWVRVYSLFQELRVNDIKRVGVGMKKSTELKDGAQPYSSLA